MLVSHLVLLALSAATHSPAPSFETVSFAEAVERAMARNTSVGLAIEEVARSRALVEQARASFLPQLSGSAIYLRLDNDRVLDGKVISAANQFTAALLLTVPIVAAKGWAGTARAADNEDVTRALTADVRRLVALSTGRAYLTIVAQHRVVEVTERARDVARVQLQFTEDRFRGGVGNKLDVTRSGQELQSAEAQLQSTLAALTRAREALGVLLGSDEPIEVRGEPELGAPTSVASALGSAEQSRADVRASKRRLEAARHSSALTYTDYLPILSGNGLIAYQNPPLLTVPLRSWQAQLVLTLPFYDGGLRYGLQKERTAIEQQAQTLLDGTLRQAKSEVRGSFEALRCADLALDASREGARLATESLHLAELAYRTGVSTNLELVDAQRRARDADTAAAVAEDNARQARLDLLSASGAFP